MFGIGSYAQKDYGTNYLREIIFSADLGDNPACTKTRHSFISLFQDDFPTVNDQPLQGIRINIGNASTDKIQNDDNHQLVMINNDASKQISYNNNKFTYRTSGKGYKSREKFNQVVIKGFNHLKKIGLEDFKSCVLRKVNFLTFSANPKTPDINKVIDEIIVGVLSPKLKLDYSNFGTTALALKNNFNTIVLEEDNYRLTIKYGVQRETLNIDDIENGEISGFIVIDLQIEILNVKDINDFESEINKCHSELFNAFHWCTTKRFRELFMK